MYNYGSNNEKRSLILMKEKSENEYNTIPLLSDGIVVLG